MTSSPFFHLHAHSHYSVKDAMASVEQMVEHVVYYGQPGLALTDHGLMSGSIRLYKLGRKHGVIPFPGSEFYLVSSVDDAQAREKRYHVGMMALSRAGYEKLVALSSRSHTRERFHRKPLIDFSDLQALGKPNDIALTTGCYFGLLIQTLITNGYPAALNVLKTYARMMPLTYVEIQNHYTHHSDKWTDAKIAVALYKMANEVGLPVVITQDSHYCDHDDQAVHNMMKQMVMVGADPGDVEFPGDGYHLCDQEWVRTHFNKTDTMKAIYRDSLESMEDLLDRNRLQLPWLDSYSFRVPEFTKDPDQQLWDLCLDALTEWWETSNIGPRTRDLHTERLNYEMAVIEEVGFASYFLLIHRIVEECNRRKILVRARGSSAGSFVCYLLGITDVDPVKWKLVFERFLTRERSKPPDIDLDIEDSRRQEIVDWLRTITDVVHIGTFSTLGYDLRTGRGSLVDNYERMIKNKTGEYWHKFASRDEVPAKDRRKLDRMAELEIKNSYGTHAAGLALGTNDVPLSAMLPTMLIASSGNTVTQMEMDDVEDAGYVKVDMLGLRTLSTLRQILLLLGRDPADGLEWIPDNDSATMTMLRRRQTEGVFQLEGYTASRGCKELGVKKTADIVALMALYRPAVLDAGLEKAYMRGRNDPARVKYVHPIVEQRLSETYGVAVFQEQVLQIMMDLGMPVEELNAILKVLKLSGKRAAGNVERLEAAHEQFEETCAEADLTFGQMAKVWELIEGFAAYGFNRAHATSYGVLAYRMAYLKQHHPIEFMTATLATTVGDQDAQQRYAREARRLGITIRKPCVNNGAANWTTNGKEIRRGLMSIKGVGMKAALEIEAHAPYVDLDDLIERTTARIVTGGKSWKKDGTLNGVLATLRQARALSALGVDPE